MKICWNLLTIIIQDVDTFSSEKIWRNITLHYQLILCSEWVPSEWESKQLIKNDHSPSIVKRNAAWLETNPLNFKLLSIIHNNTSTCGKAHALLSSHIKIHGHISKFMNIFVQNCFGLFCLKWTFCLELCTTFSLEKAILWIEDSYFSQKQSFEVENILMDLLQMHRFSLHETAGLLMNPHLIHK